MEVNVQSQWGYFPSLWVWIGFAAANNESITLEIISEPKSYLHHEVCFTTTSISPVQTRLHVFTVNLKIVKSTLFKSLIRRFGSAAFFRVQD